MKAWEQVKDLILVHTHSVNRREYPNGEITITSPGLGVDPSLAV